MPLRTNEARAPMRIMPRVRADRAGRKLTIKYHSMHPMGQSNRTTTEAKKHTTSRKPGTCAVREMKNYQTRWVDPKLSLLRDRHLGMMMDINEDYANFPEGVKFSTGALDVMMFASMEAHMVNKLFEGDTPAWVGLEIKPVMLADIPVRRVRMHRVAKGFIPNSSGDELWNDDLEIAFAELHLDG